MIDLAQAVSLLSREGDPAAILRLGAQLARDLFRVQRAAVELPGLAEPIETSGALVVAIPADPVGGWLLLAEPQGREPLGEADRSQARGLAAAIGMAWSRAILAADLHTTELLYRAVIDHLPAVTYYRRIDRPGEAWFVSRQAEALIGYTPAEITANPDWWHDHLHPDDRDETLRGQAAYDARATDGPVRGEYRLVHRDGRPRWFENHAVTLRGGTGDPTVVLGVLVDITDRKEAEEARRASEARLEEQLRQSQKMEAVGLLAGGVAHDFNNILAVIISYAALLSEQLRPGDSQLEDIEEIARAGERGHTLTRQLLAFSRQQVLEPRYLDLGAVAAGMQKLLRRLIPEDIELVTATSPDLWTVRADPGQIEQVIMNLAVNARDAIPNGGHVAIRVENAELTAVLTDSYPELPPGRYVRLTVTDDGVGMDVATRSRIFEPFFTTKGRGKGSGLGLPTALGIAQQSGGGIAVDSQPGRGTTFRVFLPVADGEVEAPPLAPPRATARSSAIVLVAEDDQQVRRAVCAALERAGFTVLETVDGADALELCRRPDVTVDLLLSDVIMPRLSGRGLVDAVREIRPNLPVLLMTGYTDDAALRDQVRDLETSIIQKPFSPAELVRRIRGALGHH